MTLDLPTSLFTEETLRPPAGHLERFGTRWRLVGAGLSNVWRYGDLVLDAPSGRLLLRGPNGTGKTTALEALWPYLLDLNAQRLVAGKSRTTSLSSLMREGATGKRRYGYAWMTLAGPGSEGTHSFGVRLQFSTGASPQVKVIPFTVPGAPITDLALYGANRAPVMLEEFSENIAAARGQIFDDDDAYVTHLAARVWNTTAPQLRELAQRIRAVRNPSLLGEVSPRAAADALREALPGVSEDIITATAEALAESDATREAFARDSEAADVLDVFAATWAGHVSEVVGAAHKTASDAAADVTSAASAVRRVERELQAARGHAASARIEEESLRKSLRDLDARIEELRRGDAFKAAGELAALEEQLGTQRQHAASTLGQLTDAAKFIREQTSTLTDSFTELADDLAEPVAAASAADAAAAFDTALVAWFARPQAVLTIGGATVDPGPALTVRADPARLEETARRWTELARQHTVRAGDAQLALTDFTKTVQRAVDEEVRAKLNATQTAAAADLATQAEDRAAAAARQTAVDLLNEVSDWPLPAVASSDGLEIQSHAVALWSPGDVEELRTAEPGQVLDEVYRWKDLVTNHAAQVRAVLLARRHHLAGQAEQLAKDAAAVRAEAADLRSGRVLPLPRPAWLDNSDDTVALAAALEWSPGFADPNARALVETALAASGLLSATLTGDGATTSAWQVRATGPATMVSLAEVLVPDVEHPLAAVAAEVLSRVALRSTATHQTESELALVIGRDGTFRAGPLYGRAPGADDPNQLPVAQHVGAAQRRAAALARAAALDSEAAELDAAAVATRESAARLQERAAQLQRHVDLFPRTRDLERQEAARVEAATNAARAREKAMRAHDAWVEAAQQATEQRLEWTERTRGRSLPADPDALTRLHTESTEAAKALNVAAMRLSGRLRTRLERLLAELARVETAAQALPRQRAVAKESDDTAAKTAEKVRTRRAMVGQAAQEALDAHASACAEREGLRLRTDPARERVELTAGVVARLGERLDLAQQNEQQSRPAAQARRIELEALLAVPGVGEVVFSDGDPDPDVLKAVTGALTGRRTYSRKTLRERYDTSRAKLAGTWTLDPADSHGELDTFVLTHDDLTFTPVAAARRAQDLKARAQAALDAAEEAALRDFVVGRLPSAIGTAWTRLHDWVEGVNRKMRSAEASSGVGVQVRARLADDLSPAVRTVHQLACKVSDADRTRDQKAAVGQALQQLIAAADGESMADKLAAAVDVREWVDVHYEVTRPGGNTQRWSSKTGLSGGERRLVVLAPMIAAVAAAYDGLVASGLRLAALDEVPAEVDERGREGLARFLAELDLDLVCTSYLWDGAPGAWDGIDAHDLEAGADGTVVAFPMLVRGLVDLPGDPTFEPSP